MWTLARLRIAREGGGRGNFGKFRKMFEELYEIVRNKEEFRNLAFAGIQCRIKKGSPGIVLLKSYIVHNFAMKSHLIVYTKI